MRYFLDCLYLYTGVTELSFHLADDVSLFTSMRLTQIEIHMTGYLETPPSGIVMGHIICTINKRCARSCKTIFKSHFQCKVIKRNIVEIINIRIASWLISWETLVLQRTLSYTKTEYWISRIHVFCFTDEALCGNHTSLEYWQSKMKF